MRFSLGLLDTLFGEKIILQGPDEKGNIVKCKVSKKWLERAQGGNSIPSQDAANDDKYSTSPI
ncbi:hypothetical protein REC12_22835 [Desulfosporosinus sp. PR]|uniref:hypothetical protein n=1 Tax=Candidatus Desulfosporosinus nitrosoreducens TaxID=3401928 RepID=UPI0027F6CA6B|nr:hypothetical protein [Desulfosporosinus sp. PR]MDQ7096436.1 hypothetical protein [Desulfosporosinus sp. PR]